ncbi:MAG: response regulator [bacterium]
MEARILAFCEDQDLCNTLVASLADRDIGFCRVDNEADLLLELLEHDYGVVIYSLESSQLDGLKMVKIIRRIRPKIPLVVISNDPSTELGGRVLQEGVIYYAMKPVNLLTLRETIIRALA